MLQCDGQIKRYYPCTTVDRSFYLLYFYLIPSHPTPHNYPTTTPKLPYNYPTPTISKLPNYVGGMSACGLHALAFVRFRSCSTLDCVLVVPLLPFYIINECANLQLVLITGLDKTAQQKQSWRDLSRIF